jgi:hypothetical protein
VEWLGDKDGGQRANLSSANLSSANLRYADLSYADLSSANLSSANLRYADLSYADLSSANLSFANLSSANLRSADLSYADLRYANLRYAILSSADLSYANLSYADLSGAKGAEPFRWLIAPQSGPFYAYKKVRDGLLLLHVPEDAKRVNAPGSRKIRVSKARVAEVLEGYGTKFKSMYDDNFIYTLGADVSADMDESPYEECSRGLHVFLTKEEAKEFSL